MPTWINCLNACIVILHTALRCAWIRDLCSLYNHQREAVQRWAEGKLLQLLVLSEQGRIRHWCSSETIKQMESEGVKISTSERYSRTEWRKVGCVTLDERLLHLHWAGCVCTVMLMAARNFTGISQEIYVRRKIGRTSGNRVIQEAGVRLLEKPPVLNICHACFELLKYPKFLQIPC